MITSNITSDPARSFNIKEHYYTESSATIPQEGQVITHPFVTSTAVANAQLSAITTEVRKSDPYCISLSERDQNQILILQAFKKTQYGNHIKIKRHCCLEAWQEQLKREDTEQRIVGEDYRQCECRCPDNNQSVDVLI